MSNGGTINSTEGVFYGLCFALAHTVQLHIAATETVTVSGTNFPAVSNSEYKCQFTPNDGLPDNGVVDAVRVSETEVTCDAPMHDGTGLFVQGCACFCRPG